LAYAALLQPVLGRRPARGWVWHKRQEDTLDEEIEPVDLVSEQRDFEQLQDEMLAIRNGAFPTSPLRCSECAQCPWRADCRNRWEREDSVCLLYGVSGQTARRLLDAGLCTIRDLLATEVDDVAQRLAWRLEDAKVLRIRAQARRENRPIVIRSPTFSEGRPVIYYDIETFGDLTYLHGLLVRVNGAAQERSFLARRPEDEGDAWCELLDYLAHQGDDPIIYCWADYERPFVERLWERHGGNSKGYAILRGNLVDECAFVQSHFAMPTHSYSIKAVAPLFGFGWQVDDASGLNSEAWYAEWLATGEERILQKILRYNLDDVRAMAVVDDGLRALVRG